eukprot:Sdes_comp16268_c0_seq1m5576
MNFSQIHTFGKPKIGFILKKFLHHTSSIDVKELRKFSQVSSEWWHPNGSFKPLHSLNYCRIGYLRNLLGADSLLPFQGKSIIDVGCGGGLLSEPLARLGANVLGIDGSPENIHIAQKHSLLDAALQGRLLYQCTTVESLVEEQKGFESCFDVVVSSEVIEHVVNPKEFLRNLFLLLKPGGTLFLSTINRTPLAFFFSILLAEYLLAIVPTGTHDYMKYVQPEEILLCLQEINQTKPPHHPSIHLDAFQGFSYDPWKNRWSFTDHLDVNYFAVAKKLTKCD